MTSARIPAIAVTVIVVAVGLTAAAQPSHRDVIPVMTHYLELVASDNFGIASDMWTPEALERSTRFEITYSDIGLKTDCNSPVIRQRDRLSTRLGGPIRGYTDLEPGNWYELEYAGLFGTTRLEHKYYAQRRGDWFWFAYAQDYYAAEWPMVESQYLRIHVDPEAKKYVNQVALAEADRFVESIAEQLDMASERLQLIGDKKIEYFYCRSDSVVEQITGFLVKGTLDLASNDVISSDFPHFHEMTHLLVNIHLQELPLYTLPLVREGLAVKLAGRWGKHPAVLMDLATALIDQQLVTIDSVLSMDGFESESGADIVYPVTGLFCDFLIEKMGTPAFLELYLKLSGQYEYVDGLTTNEIQVLLAESIGQESWSDLATDFEAFLADHSDYGLVARAGLGENGRELLAGANYRVLENEDWIAVEFRGEAGGAPPQGNLVFAPIKGLKSEVSQLFDSQYGDRQPFAGHRFGIRYDQNEIGLYDYGANLLVAKYIWGITPSEEYYDADQNVIRARFDKKLLRGRLPTAGECQLLPL